MIQLGSALIVFLVAMVVHLLLCRQFDKKLHFGLFIFTFLMGYIVLWLTLSASVLLPFPVEYKYSAKLTYVLLNLLYFFFFRLANQDTPYQLIVKTLENQTKATFNELEIVIEKENLITKGLQNLVKGGYIKKKNNKYFLTGKGRVLALSSSLDRKVLIRPSERI